MSDNQLFKSKGSDNRWCKNNFCRYRNDSHPHGCYWGSIDKCKYEERAPELSAEDVAYYEDDCC